jgi:hypothetical protein
MRNIYIFLKLNERGHKKMRFYFNLFNYINNPGLIIKHKNITEWVKLTQNVVK